MNQFKVLAGPCVIESESAALHTAESLKKIMETKKENVDFYFKASFDKANRTSVSSFRGPGIQEGLRILTKVKKEFDLKIITDIHEPWQAEPTAEVADIIQIPAFLSRQTDLLAAAARTGKTINIKKSQYSAPWDMKNVIKKITENGNRNILLCERGTFFGYNSLVVDMTSLIEMKKLGYPVIFDATHSVQKPGGNGDSTSGNRQYAKYLARAATAVGIDGIFAEVHPNPDTALSDGPNMIKLEDFPELLHQILEIHGLTQVWDNVEKQKKNNRL